MGDQKVFENFLPAKMLPAWVEKARGETKQRKNDFKSRAIDAEDRASSHRRLFLYLKI